MESLVLGGSRLNIGSLGPGHLGWDMLSRVWVRPWDGPGQGGGPWVGVVKDWVVGRDRELGGQLVKGVLWR